MTIKLRVLVADDSASMHSIFTEIGATSPIPFDVVRANNGRECAEMLSQGGFNLAFIDVNMPEMDGMEAVSLLRQGGHKTFISLMSGTNNAERLALARQLKVYEFLQKPFTPTQVQTILRTYSRISVPTQALIVDDSATVRRIIGKVLDASIFNIDPTQAGNGDEAIELCGSGDFAVVFLDCNMPGLNGFETLERMLERDPDVKVIMISGERNEERRRQALDRGAIAFLYKPFHAVDIDRELHALFNLKMPLLAATEPSPKIAALAK